MTLSDELVQNSQGILKIYPELHDQTGYYQMFDDGGTEIQVSEFLWGLVKLLQPEEILESGTFTGISSLFMAEALKENKHGHLITLEIDNIHKERAENLWKKCEVSSFVTCVLESSLKYTPETQIDFMFLDSEPDIRWKELVKFYPYLKPGGFVFLHDCPRGFCKGNVNPDHPELKDWPWGPVPQKIQNWIKDGDLVKWHFPNPREMVGFYKPRLDDYRV